MSTPDQATTVARPDRSFDLIAFDLDGTVFGTPTNQVMSPRVCAAFEAAHNAGVAIAVASGRPAWMLGQQIPAAPWMDWAITCNGTRVSGYRRSDLDFANGFSRGLAEAVLACLNELGGSASIHTNRASLMERRHLTHMASDFKKQSAELGEALPDNPIDKLLSTFGGVAVDSAVEAFRARPDEQLDKVDCKLPTPEAADELVARLEALGGVGIARLNAINFELTSAAASKGDATTELCRRLGIDPARAVAFGDSGNDLSMTGRELTFVAMGNASPEVKAAADDVTDSVFDDGVATWIEAHL